MLLFRAAVLSLALLPFVASANVLPGGEVAKWRPGPPPKPWQHTATKDGITVKVVDRAGRKWIEFRDRSAEAGAGLRAEVPAMRAGRLSFRIEMAEDHESDLGFYLGTGAVSKAEERVVDVKTGRGGVLRLGSANERVPTGVTLVGGVVEHLFIEFRPAGEGIHLRLGRISDGGDDQLVTETTLAKPAEAISRVRITSDVKTEGAHFFITDLKLVPLKTP